ncbi:MAG: thymidine phosphorylase [Planctomycetes bacterium]|nr:thymidine phosphorylase [Planctomycetota bacterium]
MNPVQLIARKRDGRELTRAEILQLIQGFSAGRIPNYQMSALLMAIYLKGMTVAETAALTEEMLASGKTLSWTSAATAAVPLAQSTQAGADAHPRLERSQLAKESGSSRPGTETITLEDDEEELSGLDARDTVDLGEEFFESGTVLLDGTANLNGQSSGGRDTIELDADEEFAPRVPTVRGAVVDKHSTGGLGDKTSLIVAPLLACCGLRVPMISGRGLGATGGTLDKLESIPGFRTDLTLDEIQAITERVGCVITGATAELAPADRKLYSLRDVTATVASIPLITASIMSKKLAEGLDALVLDVKWGSGAFMKTLSNARKLAESLVETGRLNGVKVVALLTNMDQPLGRMIGNSAEVDEVLEVLTGGGPEDLWQVTRDLGAELLVATGIASDHAAAGTILSDHIRSGRAALKFREMVTAQGGDLDAPRPRTDFQFEIRAIRSGYVGKMNAETLGLTLIELGGGRRVLSDIVDHSVGLEMLVRIGDRVQTGQPLVRVHCHERQVDSVRPLLRTAIPIRPQPVEPPVLIAERIDATEPSR